MVLQMLKGISVQPSSPELKWKTITGLLRSQVYPHLDMMWLDRYFQFVDAAANEMRKMPVLCDILVQGLKLYPTLKGKKLEIIPFRKDLNNYCKDYLVAVADISSDGKVIKV